MTSFVKIFAFFLLLAIAGRLLPGIETLILAEIAFLAVYLRSAHRGVVQASEAKLRATFDQDPSSQGTRELMIAAGYNV